MTHEALYYAFYYVIVLCTQATNQDLVFIRDQPYFEAIWYIGINNFSASASDHKPLHVFRIQQEVADICILHKAIANSLVGKVLARPPFIKVKTKFHFTKSKY